MAQTSKFKKGKVVAVEDRPMSEEEQDEDNPQDHRGVSHLQTAENMLNAVSWFLKFSY
jgi:hypothetical protein